MTTKTLIALAAAAVLAFDGAAAWAQSLQTPPGSYRASCNSVRAYRGPNGARIVTATCRTANGRWLQSSLRFGDCRGDIANINGRLTCKRSGPPGPGPGGNPGPLPPASLVLFGQPGYRGASIVLRGPTRSLAPWSFGDKTKSLQVRGRGRWQVCTLTDYRGRCEIVGDSVYDLGTWRLSNQISSARPVGR